MGNFVLMPNIQQHPVLEHITAHITAAIADAKLETVSESVSIIKDGNDSIQLEQLPGSSDNATIIQIIDRKEILYSEDLLESLQEIGELKNATIVVNGLSIETEFVFQAVKDCFDTLSSSYQFVKTIAKRIDGLTISFQFGDHKFELTVLNNPDEVQVTAQIDSVKDAKVQKTIEADVVKVQQALNKLFKA